MLLGEGPGDDVERLRVETGQLGDERLDHPDRQSAGRGSRTLIEPDALPRPLLLRLLVSGHGSARGAVAYGAALQGGGLWLGGRSARRGHTLVMDTVKATFIRTSETLNRLVLVLGER